jgi:hypothetical protein
MHPGMKNEKALPSTKSLVIQARNEGVRDLQIGLANEYSRVDG